MKHVRQSTNVLAAKRDGGLARLRRASRHENLDDAIAIAERVPVVAVGTIEIRPVLEIAGLPEKFKKKFAHKPVDFQLLQSTT